MRNNFSSSEGTLPMKTFTGQRKLLAGSAVQLQLSYCQMSEKILAIFRRNFDILTVFVKFCFFFTISRVTPTDSLGNSSGEISL
jgi:hypothetical protein